MGAVEIIRQGVLRDLASIQARNPGYSRARVTTRRHVDGQNPETQLLRITVFDREATALTGWSYFTPTNHTIGMQVRPPAPLASLEWFEVLCWDLPSSP